MQSSKAGRRVLEGIFEPSSLTFTATSNVRVGDRWVPLGPTPANQGMKVEGAFAQAIISIFQSYVVGSASASANVPRSVNGDVTETAPWIRDPGVKQRFKSAIWGPLHAVRSSEPSTADFVAKMQDLNPDAWPDMVTKLNAFNMAMDAPQINSISPASGPEAGGQSITISGVFLPPWGDAGNDRRPCRYGDESGRPVAAVTTKLRSAARLLRVPLEKSMLS